MSGESFIQIAPGIVFSAGVFTPVDLPQPPIRRYGSLTHTDIYPSAADPRQIDLWADDAEHAPELIRNP